VVRRDDAVDDFERDRLVVSLQRNDLLGQPGLQIDHAADDAGALRPPVDVVAKKYEGHRLTAGVSFTTLDEALQLAQRAVNIANSENQGH
jgi:hypothetical protein